MRPSCIRRILEREFLGAAQGAHTAGMPWGPPGVGKSQIIAGIAASHGAALIDVRLSSGKRNSRLTARVGTDTAGRSTRAGTVRGMKPTMLVNAHHRGRALPSATARKRLATAARAGP